LVARLAELIGWLFGWLIGWFGWLAFSFLL